MKPQIEEFIDLQQEIVFNWTKIMSKIENTKLEEGYIRCEYSYIVTTTQPETNKHGAHLVDFGDVRHWIPKSCCKFPDKNQIDIKEWKYNELKL